jgi:hypothetical protein
VVGVIPLKAGFEHFAIHPQSSTLNHIDAKIPTIKGEITVKIDSTPKSYTMKVSTPANTTAEVILPCNGIVKHLLIDGKKATIKQTSKNSIDCGTIGSGEHIFELIYE